MTAPDPLLNMQVAEILRARSKWLEPVLKSLLAEGVPSDHIKITNHGLDTIVEVNGEQRHAFHVQLMADGKPITPIGN